MTFSPALPVTTPHAAAERTLRKPSSAVWLRGVRVRTARFDDALAFYGTLLGLTLGGVRVHPVSSALSAQMTDAEGHPILEIVEAADAATGAGPELAFGMPRRTWQLLRARLDTQMWPYEATDDCLYVADADGTALRIESMGDLGLARA